MALQSIDAHLIMHLHWLQHVPFEGLGMIQSWAAAGGHSLSCTRFWAADKLPEPDSMDMLIVMGGPMGGNDEGVYPWLVLEKNFIRRPAPPSCSAPAPPAGIRGLFWETGSSPCSSILK